MFSIADMAVAGAVALLLFGPDQLPKVARRAGQLVRDVQNTSQSFIREMERAADASEHVDVTHSAAVAPATAAPAYHETPEPAPVHLGSEPAADQAASAVAPHHPTSVPAALQGETEGTAVEELPGYLPNHDSTRSHPSQPAP